MHASKDDKLFADRGSKRNLTRTDFQIIYAHNKFRIMNLI